VSADGQEVDIPFLNIDRNPPRCLSGVTVDHSTDAMGDLRYLCEWLESANLIVGGLDTYHRGLRIHVIDERSKIELPVLLYRNRGKIESLLVERATGFKNRFVLCRSCEDSCPTLGGGTRGAEEREIVTLGCSGREHDFASLAPNELRHTLASCFDSGRRVLTSAVRHT
jgi:hypothetical protein